MEIKDLIIPIRKLNRKEKKLAEKEIDDIIDRIMPNLRAYEESAKTSVQYDYHLMIFEKSAANLNAKNKTFKVNVNFFSQYMKTYQEIEMLEHPEKKPLKIALTIIAVIIIISILCILF